MLKSNFSSVFRSTFTYIKKMYQQRPSSFLLTFVSLFFFLIMLIFALREKVNSLDLFINQNFNTLHSTLSNQIMLFFTDLGDVISLAVLSTILFLYLFFRKRWNHLFILVLGMGGGFLLRTIIKLLVHRARPENALLQVSEYSFPSGHALMSLIFFCILIYCLKDEIKNKVVKYSFISLNILLFLTIGFSRIYFNVHWLSDVLGGFALGIFWLTVVILFFDRNHQSNAKI